MKDQPKTEISKIEIKVAGETLRLTLDQAKELQEILNKTFPKAQPNQLVPVPYPVDRPYPVPVPRPYPVYPPRRPYDWEYWRTTYSMQSRSVGGGATMCLALK